MAGPGERGEQPPLGEASRHLGAEAMTPPLVRGGEVAVAPRMRLAPVSLTKCSVVSRLALPMVVRGQLRSLVLVAVL